MPSFLQKAEKRFLIKLPAAFNGAEKSELVSVLNVSADGNTVGKTSDLNARRLDETADIHGGSLTFNRGVGGDHNLFSSALLDTVRQREKVERIRAFAASGRDNSAQNVINSAELLNLLKGNDSLGVLNNADKLFVALGI